jgi:DnaJ-class molecular chaperone
MIITEAKVREAMAALELVEGDEITELSVNKAYRLASKSCHPDSGTHDPAKWQRVSWAKELLLQQVAQRGTTSEAAKGTCRACGGTGRIRRRTGFSAGPVMVCAMCGGSGSPKIADREE